MAKCKYCDDEIGFGEFLPHMWDKHRDISEQIKQKAVQKRQEGAGKRAKGQGSEDSGALQSVKSAASTRLAKSIDEAVSVVVAPRRFEMSSTLLWQAMKAAIKEWRWPEDITPGDFVDTFLFLAFQQRGILLGGYTVLDKDGKEGKDGS